MWRFNEIQHLSLESLREPMTCPDLRAGNQFGQSPYQSQVFQTSHIFHVIDELRLRDLARAILDAKSYDFMPIHRPISFVQDTMLPPLSPTVLTHRLGF